MSQRYLEDVLMVSGRCLGVLTVFGRCFDCIWKVFERCLEGVWKVFEGLWKLYGRCLEHVWKVYETYLEGVQT